jgi:hypothetical protein
VPNGNNYGTLFAQHRSARVPTAWGWQSEVLAAYATVGGENPRTPPNTPPGAGGGEVDWPLRAQLAARFESQSGSNV